MKKEFHWVWLRETLTQVFQRTCFDMAVLGFWVHMNYKTNEIHMFLIHLHSTHQNVVVGASWSLSSFVYSLSLEIELKDRIGLYSTYNYFKTIWGISLKSSGSIHIVLSCRSKQATRMFSQVNPYYPFSLLSFLLPLFFQENRKNLACQEKSGLSSQGT